MYCNKLEHLSQSFTSNTSLMLLGKAKIKGFSKPADTVTGAYTVKLFAAVIVAVL
jgi:hypothetical protein